MTSTLKFSQPVPARPHERSFWIQSTDPTGPETSAPLRGNISTPIAIVGGGLTGLWTAWRILEQRPEQQLVILEADFCGSGASGRNGGQVHTWYGSLGYLRALVGKKEAIELARATADAIDEFEELQQSGEIDMDLRLDGWIRGASAKAHEGIWEGAAADLAQHGDTPYRPLDAEELKERTGSASSYEGLIEDRAGSMNPYKLARGLRKRLMEKGVTIYEGTPVEAIAPGRPARLKTPRGVVTADQVLIATNAWAGSIPEINRYMYSVDGQVIVTEPIPERLDALGWKSGASIADSQMQVLYWQRTVDGRVLLGQGSGLPIYKAKLGPKNNRNPKLVPPVVRELHRLYPSLSDVKIDYDWVGPIDIVATHIPMLGTLEQQPNVLYAVGWSGTALAQIPAVARILASRLLGIDDKWGRSKLFNQNRRTRIFPEPLRFIGANLVRLAVINRVRREIQNKRVDPITKFLVSLMPRYRAPGEVAPD
ncbi:NAD(P)/FAD-dependent oxidoreductase [Ruicaihuangia caeni]|uniref:FAD-dependent oxidoreductase n=1 Tax=Ruicaihuangia caeni TaxID=3042517 RepID=A0AAW6TA11_9MICO|nr:FAD-dependent oxidoreductase [Klugiella sp. YN-L-19]MDI2099214.1 FAD-dependent oxidoreductase [Klugiella sp. YN-L-19]